MPIPVPMRRTTVTDAGQAVRMTTLLQVLQLTRNGDSCVRETSHMMAMSANFYFLCFTGFPLAPVESLVDMAGVV